MKTLIVLFICSISLHPLLAQKTQKVVVAFYNCENFYDTIRNPAINDDEYLPASPKHYDSNIYNRKLHNIAKVIAEIGKDIQNEGAAIIGLAEIENDTVLNDLVRQPLLRKRNYCFIHFDSPDPRGMDVALLYNPEYFIPDTSQRLFVKIPVQSKSAITTRDILWVRGKLKGEIVNLYINHWPSRFGGEEKSSPAREAAATTCKRHLDSLFDKGEKYKTIIMGDFNDNPVDKSIADILNAKKHIQTQPTDCLYNPAYALFKKGEGSIAFQDSWNLFDQIIISSSLCTKQADEWQYSTTGIFKPWYLIENQGKFKGYPKRSWDGNNYNGGYSDHFPVYIILQRTVNK